MDHCCNHNKADGSWGTRNSAGGWLSLWQFAYTTLGFRPLCWDFVGGLLVGGRETCFDEVDLVDVQRMVIPAGLQICLVLL